MRFSTVSVALCLIAGVFAIPAPPAGGAQTGQASPGAPAGLAGNGLPVGALASTLAGLTKGAPVGKRGLLPGLGGDCASDPQSPCNAPRPETHPSPPLPPHKGGCSAGGNCPVGPKNPTDCVGIIQSLLRELYPTLDFVAGDLDSIVASVLSILGATDLSDAFLHGRIGLLNDLVATLGCTVDQLVAAIEQVVSGLAH